MNTSARIVATGIMISLLSSCYDYPAVNSASGTMQKAITSWVPFADDYVATCQRRLAFDPSLIDATIDNCNGMDDTQKQLSAAIVILQNYFSALADIASDGDYTFDAGIDGFGTPASKLLKSDDGTKAKAVIALAKDLANLLAAGVRKSSLDHLIKQVPSVEILVEAVRSSLVDDYGRMLIAEQGQLKVAISPLAQSAGFDEIPTCGSVKTAEWKAPYPSNQLLIWNRPYPSDAKATASGGLFQHSYVDQCNAIVARSIALKKVDDSARDVTDALHKLEEHKDDLKSSGAATDLLEKAEALAKDIQDVQSAFSAGAMK